MAFFPRFSYLSLYGGELHRKGGVLMKARLTEWERELQYLRFRIAEWKEFGTVDHPDYYAFRSFVLQKVRNHLHFELKTLSSILMACEVAARSDDVPPLQNYIDAIYTFRERISPGEITRRIHLEEWHRYMRTKDEETDDTQPQMDDMFAKIRNEIAGMERRIKEFKLMVDELVRMVGAMRRIEKVRQEGAGRGRGRGRGRGPDGSENGYWIRSATRIPPHPVHGPGGARRMVRSPTDLLPNSRARLPPLISPPPPPPPPSHTPNASNSSSPRRIPTSTSSSVSRSQPRQRQAAGSSAVISRTIILPSSPSPPPAPPRPARNNIHRGFFHRVFHMSQNTSTNTTPLPTRAPSPVRSPSPLGSPPTPPPHDPDFSRHESPSASSIAETRTRLPPSPEESPIPYRPPLSSSNNL